jgi:hypothetical protein
MRARSPRPDARTLSFSHWGLLLSSASALASSTTRTATCPSPKVRPADQREFWRGKGRTPRPRRSPRCGTSAGRRSPCLQDVDPGDNSTVFGRNRLPSCSPARWWRGRDRGTGRGSLKCVGLRPARNRLGTQRARQSTLRNRRPRRRHTLLRQSRHALRTSAPATRSWQCCAALAVGVKRPSDFDRARFRTRSRNEQLTGQP